MTNENIEIRTLMNGDTPFYPQTDIHGLVCDGEYGIDDKPVAESDNLVKSGGVYDAIAESGVYDVTANNNNASFADLATLLSD